MNSPLYTWFGLNESIFHAINNVKQPWLDAFMQFGTALGAHGLVVVYGPILLLIAAFASFRHLRAQRLSAAALWIATIFTFAGAFAVDAALLSYLKPLFDFPRPPLALGVHAVKILGGLKDFHHSFPSGHASFAMTVVASLWLVLTPRLRVFAALFVAWVAVSRIYVGAHFPADVCAGMLSALVIVTLVRFIALAVASRMVGWLAGRLALRARLA